MGVVSHGTMQIYRVKLWMELTYGGNKLWGLLTGPNNRITRLLGLLMGPNGVLDSGIIKPFSLPRRANYISGLAI